MSGDSAGNGEVSPLRHPLETFSLRKTILKPRVMARLPHEHKDVPHGEEARLPVVLEQAGQELLCDFGVETVGYVTCEWESSAAASLTIRYGESLGEALSDDPFDIGWYHRATDVLPSSTGVAQFRTAYRRGFRYARVRFAEGHGAVVVKAIRVEQVHYPFAREGRFACSDSLLNRIWAIAHRTLLLSGQQWYEDGIKRDGMLWVGDFRIAYLCNTTLFGDQALARKCLAAFANAQMPSGAIPATGNNGGVGLEWRRTIDHMSDCGAEGSWHSKWLVANYAYDWVLSLQEYYEHTADSAFVRQVWPQAHRAICWIVQDGRGDVVMDLMNGQWYGSDAWISIWRYWAITAGKNLGRLVGDSEVEADCTRYLQGKREELRARYFDSGEGCFAVGDRSYRHRHASAAAVLAGIVSPAEAVSMFSRLACMTELRQEEVGMAKFYVHRALMEAGMVSEALDDMRGYYGCMLEYEATTCWERCPLNEVDPITSRCHGWSSGPAYLFPTYLLGVKPAAPGFQRVRIVPHLAGLQWVEGSIPLPHGDLTVRWEAGKTVKGVVTLPAGVTGDLVIEGENGGEMRSLRPGENVVG